MNARNIGPNTQAQIRKAVSEANAYGLGLIADWLRFKYGQTYEQVFGIVSEITGISRPAFESLMYEADGEESND